MMDDSLDEPCRDYQNKRQKLELKLESWNDFFNLINACSGELARLYVVEMLLRILEAPCEVMFGLDNLTQLLQNCYSIVTSTESGASLKMKTLQICCRSFERIKSVHERHATRPIAKKLLDFGVEQLSTPNLESVSFEIILTICDAYQQTDEIQQTTFDYLFTTIDNISTSTCMSTDDISAEEEKCSKTSFVKILSWALNKNFVGWLRKNSQLKNTSLSEVNEWMKKICLKIIGLVLSITCNNAKLTLTTAMDHSRLAKSVLLQLCRVGTVEDKLNCCLWKYFCSSLNKMMDDGKNGKMVTSKLVYVLSLCAQFLSLPDSAMNECKKDLYCVTEDCLSRINKEIELLMSQTDDVIVVEKLGNVLQSAFVGTCLLSHGRVTLNGTAKQQQMRLLISVTSLVQKMLKFRAAGSLDSPSYKVLGGEVRTSSCKEQKLGTNSSTCTSLMDLIVKATQVIFMLADETCTDSLELISDQVFNVNGSLWKENGFILVFEKLLSEKFFVESLSSYWVAQTVTTLTEICKKMRSPDRKWYEEVLDLICTLADVTLSREKIPGKVESVAAVIHDSTLPTLWSIMSSNNVTLEFRENVVRCSVIFLCSSISDTCSSKERNIHLLDEDADANFQPAKIIQFILEEFVKGHKNLSLYCAEGLMKYCNACVHNLIYILDQFQLKLNLVWNSLKQGEDCLLVLKTNMVVLLSKINIVSVKVQENVFKILAFCLQRRFLSLNEVADILKSHCVVSEILGERFLKAIAKELLINFDLQSIMGLCQLLGNNTANVSGLLLFSPLEFLWKLHQNGNTGLSDDGILTGLSSIDFHQLHNSQQGSIFAAWFSTSFLQGSANLSAQTFNQLLSLDISSAQFNDLLATNTAEILTNVLCLTYDQNQQDVNQNVNTCFSVLLKSTNIGRFECYVYAIQVKMLDLLEESLQLRVFEFVDALKKHASFTSYLTSESISSNCNFYLETFFAKLFPLERFCLESQPPENISSVCRSICLMASYAVQCKWAPIKFYIPLLIEVILTCRHFVARETLFRDDILVDAWLGFMQNCLASEERVMELLDEKLIYEMCAVSSKNEKQKNLFSKQLLSARYFEKDDGTGLRELLEKINQYLKDCPKKIHCLRNVFRVIVPVILSVQQELLLKQDSFTETCELIIEQMQNEDGEHFGGANLLSLINSQAQINLMHLLLQHQTRSGSIQPLVGNHRGTNESSIMSLQTLLSKIYSLLIGDAASLDDIYLTHLVMSATQQLANQFPNETKSILSSSKNNYFNAKIEECFKNDFLSSIVNNKDEDLFILKKAKLIVLTDVQYLMLSLFADNLQMCKLNDSFGCLEQIVLTCPVKASQLLPVFCVLVSTDIRRQVSESFEQKFIAFSDEDCCGESVMPYFNCVLELMTLQQPYKQAHTPNISHLKWLDVDYSLLCTVAYKLKHYCLAIMFCEMSVMKEIKFDMNYSSRVPIDESNFFDLQQIAIKSSLAKNPCHDSAIGFGIERLSYSDEELEVLRYTNCCQLGDNAVATILSSVKKLGTSLSSRGPKHCAVMAKLLKESPIADFADLLSLPQVSFESEEWSKFEKFGTPSISEEYMKQLSDWNQLEFLDKTSSFDVFFICELGYMEKEQVSKLNLGSELLMAEIRTENFSWQSVSCAVFKFTNCKYLIEGFVDTNLIRSKLPRIQWHEDLHREKLDNLFMFQKVVLDRMSKRLDVDEVSTTCFGALQNEMGREYVGYLISKKRFHAAETLLDLLTKNSSSESCYESLFCKLLWDKGNRSQAMSRLAKLVQNSKLATKSESLKAQAQLQLAQFHIEACSETPAEILQLLERGLQSATSDVCTTQQCLLSLAKFADEQYVKIDQLLRSEENQKVKNRIKITERELGCMLTQAATDCRYYREIQARQWRDVREQEMYVSQRGQFLEKALQSYLAWLKNASSWYSGQSNGGQDLALFRVISLWFANDTDRNIASFLAARIFDISVDHFVHVIPQLVGRLPSAEQSSRQSLDLFDEILQKLLVNIGNKHFFHAVYNLLAVINAQMEAKYNKKLKQASLDKKRIDAALAVLNSLSYRNRELKSVKILVDAYLETAYADRGKYKNQYVTADFTRSTKLMQVKNLTSIPVPTTELHVEPNGDYSKVAFVLSFDKRFSVCGGINAPRVVEVNCSDGTIRKQLVKGNDDLRQDAVMQQVFGLCNRLLGQNIAARKRNLCMKTYKVVALAPNCGVLEWCEGTIPLGDYLCGSKGTGKQDVGAHQRYRPSDWANKDCHIEMAKCRETNQGSEQALLKTFEKICRHFQPVLHFFFLETFKDAEVWFEKRICFTRSVATSSMIGYIVGLGDRHTSNILLSTMSAEIVHIDLGMAFEQGRELSVPETVPFRLTRDLVSAFGVSSVEGVFRKACELTMSVLRNNHDVITTIAQVLVHDPLYNWTLSPVKALMMEGEDLEENNNPAAFLSAGSDKDLWDQSETRKNQSAVRVVERICAKLKGMDGSGDSAAALLSVEGQVNWLIKEATDFRNLSKLFHGWRPWA